VTVSFLVRRRSSRWILAIVGWTAVGLFFASQTYLTYSSSGGKAPIGFVLGVNLFQWYLWAAVAPGIIWLARTCPLDRRHWLWSVPIHGVAGVAIALIAWQVNNLFQQHVLGVRRTTPLVYVFHQNLVTYALVVAATQGYLYYHRYRQSEIRSAQLSTQLAQAELQALRMQLHPHFLFNTLNAISTLVHKDPEAADRMIARLSDLLRLSLENVGVQEVPLAQEIGFLERYLDIERTRFGDRLVVRLDVAPETLDASTPYLILQPLVENAIRHGVASRATAGQVAIRARRDNGMLVLEIRDDGPGVPVGGPPKRGVGLSSTRARLEGLYGPGHRFDWKNGEAGGSIVTVAFPFRLLTSPEGASGRVRESS
jgi:two-component system LytT family sensor kinase